VKRSKKEELVESLRKDFQEYETAIAVDYRGLDVAEITDLRNRLREESCSFRVVKNTLSIIASEGTDYESIKEHFQGPTALAFTRDNPVSLAKILTEYAKEHKSFEVKLGLQKGKIISVENIREVAKLPSREILIGQLVGLIQAPVRNVVSMIQAPCRSLVTVLKAVAEKKESEQH